MTILTRQLDNATDADLLSKARSLLGYSPKKKGQNIPPLLKQFFIDSDIRPFYPEDVKNYQFAKQNLHTERDKTSGRYIWKEYKISEYPKQVPEFALQTAIDVKRFANENNMSCEIYVEDLEKQASVQPQDDPFLAAIIDNQLYYLEVWDEPNFKEKRQL